MSLVQSVYMYLIPPYLAINQTASIYGINLPVGEGSYSFGYVQLTNYATLGFNVGDRVLFDTTGNKQIIINSDPYFLVDEKKLFLIEPINPLP